ncbi:hypothetical protein [Thalassotalea litorea]|uniref:hypothetical protein n=1 Tax=Thalassotalea litorea TaxID=2020715 RepID=UPI003736E079
MKRTTNGFILILSAILSLLTPVTYAAKRAIPYQVLYQESEHDADSFASKTIMVIRDWNAYTDAVVKHTNEEIVDVNFSQSQVLMIDMGNRPNTGYGLKINRVLEFDHHIVVYTKFSVLHDTSGECLPGEAITNPIVFLKINSLKEIIVREKYKPVTCR